MSKRADFPSVFRDNEYCSQSNIQISLNSAAYLVTSHPCMLYLQFCQNSNLRAGGFFGLANHKGFSYRKKVNEDNTIGVSVTENQ